MERELEKYFLIDMERTISTGLAHYWKAGGWGYTPRLKEAGRYSEQEAADKVASDRDNLTYGIKVKDALKLVGLQKC